jgi:hypothetical protein
MILRYLLQKDGRDKAAKLPVAMMFLVVGLALLIVGILWPHFASPAQHFAEGWSGFCRGLLFGVGIGMETVGVVIALKAAREARRGS